MRALPGLRRARLRLARPGIDLRGRAPAARAGLLRGRPVAGRHRRARRRHGPLARAVEPSGAGRRAPADGLQGRRPARVPRRAVGPLRRPGARDGGARAGRHPLPLDADAGVGGALQARRPGDLQAGSQGLRRLRRRARAALLGRLPRREPGRRRAAAGQPLVAGQRAEPARLADPPVRAQARPARGHGGRRLPAARPRGHPRAASRRPRPRPDPARRDVADRPHERLAGAPVGRAPRVPPQALLPHVERAPADRRRGARTWLPELRQARGPGARPSSLPARRLPGAPPAPAEPPQRAGEITISTPSRLHRVLDQAGRAHRIPRRLPIFYTEYGFQTNPPDRIFGVRATLQPAYINQSDWMAYRDPRARAVAQYKLVDEAALSSFQSGLRFVDGRAKPAYGAYRLPIWVSGRGSRLRVYGQVRPAPDSTPQVVQIQSGPRRGGAFTTVKTLTVRSRKGQFLARVERRPGVWRLLWNGLTSREAAAARR